MEYFHFFSGFGYALNYFRHTLQLDATVVGFGDGVFDQRRSVARCLSGAPGQIAYFIGHYRETHSGLARASGFHCGIQSQDIRLEGNLVDHLDNLRDPSARFGDGRHGLDHLTQGLVAFAHSPVDCIHKVGRALGLVGALARQETISLAAAEVSSMAAAPLEASLASRLLELATCAEALDTSAAPAPNSADNRDRLRVIPETTTKVATSVMIPAVLMAAKLA